jgi:hypothetical protein
MSLDREPFFTPNEWKAIVLFRPREWREWWRTEPLLTKVFAATALVILGWGLYELLRGNTDMGGTLVGLVGILLAIVVVVPFVNIFVAGQRWILRESGVLGVWLKIRKYVLVTCKVVLWTGFIVMILVALGPYLSLDPVKSWYALTHEVPAERVEVEKKPHDCEFSTAPIGVKNCHYDAKVFVMKGDNSSKAERSLLVAYEKVED